MATQISDTAGGVASQAGGMTGTPLGSMTGVLQGGLANLFDSGKGILDKWFPPEKREELKNKLTKFATERPKFAAFLLSQIALSGGPLALFFVMSLTVLIFALVAGILVGVVGAVLFTVFCLGVALIILLPTLFVTTFAGAFIFLWGLGAYYIVKWFNQKDVPGVHTNGKDGVQKQLGLDSLPSLNGDAGPSASEKTNKEAPPGGDDTNGSAHGHEKKQPHSKSKSKSPPATKRSANPGGKATGSENGPVGDVKKTAGGVTSGVTSQVGL